MKVKSDTKLAIFSRFKINGELTGEAIRQRAIITILGNSTNPAERTRTGISQSIARGHGIAWKNIYSGIFRDLDEILIPMGIAEEDGRLPLRRGPKALQEKGIPYYHLTKKGLLVGLSISKVENLKNLLRAFFLEADLNEKKYEKIIKSLSEISPNFTYSIFQKYIEAFCDNKIIDLLPFDLSKLKNINDESLMIQREIIGAVLKLSKEDKDDAMGFFGEITESNF